MIGFNITWVGFFEVKASDSSRSRHRFFRGLEVGKFEVCTSNLRQSGRLRDCSGGKPLDIYLGWLPLALLDPLNQAIALFHVQLRQQFQCLIVAAAQVFTDFLGGVVDIDPPFIIVPTVLCGKAHSVQHEAIQQLRFRGQPFEPLVTDQGAWDAVKAELTAFIAVVVIENLYIAHLQLPSYC